MAPSGKAAVILLIGLASSTPLCEIPLKDGVLLTNSANRV